MKIVMRKPKDLIGAEYNPRELTDKQYRDLKDSLQRFGFVDPILVNINPDRKDIIIGGHQRTRVAEDLKIKEVPTVEVDLTLEQEKELNIRLNKNSGQWDMEALANFFETDELVEWGFDESELVGWEEEVTHLEAEEDDFEVPDEVHTDIVQGDLIEIGEHRLLCGDSTSVDDVERLMDGKMADMVFTDPPYNIAFKPQRGTHEEILNDDMSNEDFEQFLRDVFSMCDHVLKDNTVLISFMGWSTIAEFQIVLRELFIIKSMPVWVKNNFGIGYFTRPKHEPSFLCLKGKPEKPETAPADVFEAAKVHKTTHSCEKPVELIRDMIIPFSKVKDLFYEPFGGSGSTMATCHQLSRVCYSMELDPKYCQVIVDRMMKLDPKLEVKINGKPYKKEG